MVIRPELRPPLRFARPDDVDDILRLIRELAEYEREPDKARADHDQLDQALFGEAADVYANVAEDASGEVVGFALFFRNFSTWEGRHGLHLEDLYVEPRSRGNGLGLALLASVTEIAAANDYARVEWQVLDWNAPAIDFYDSLGAEPLDEWITYRLSPPSISSHS